MHCGAELDDFAPCSCGLAPRRVKPSTWSMRELVTRKLERQRAERAQKESS
jgi:hypothetical protein